MNKSKRRILIIDGPLGGGGAERVLIDILRNLDYDRYDVDLALICRGGALMHEVPEQVRVIELWPGYTLGYKLALRMSKYLHSNLLLSRKMNGPKLRRDYDVEISFLEGLPLKLGALRTTQARKITWVHADLYTHRYEAPQFYPGEELRAYNAMDTVVNVSRNADAAFALRFPSCTTPRRIIHNPIDTDRIHRLAGDEAVQETNRKFTVSMVGRLTKAKNPELFLQVARLALNDNLPVRFRWIGDGDMRAQAETLRDAMGLTHMVEFTGFRSNPYPLLRESDVLLITSDYESFCLAAVEAMALGVPVIATRTAGTCEIIGDNEHGIITDHTPQALYAALRHWIDNPTERQQYATAALSRPEAYGIRNTMLSISQLIEQ